MPSTILFDPSFLLSLDFVDIDFSVCEADPDFSVDRVSVNGVDYVLVMPNDVVNGGYPESRWTIVDGVVTEMTVHWDSPFTDIDGINLDRPEHFVADWNRRFNAKLHIQEGNQIWSENNSVVLAPNVLRFFYGCWQSITYFNPAIASHKRTPAYFAPGPFDAPHIVEQFLDAQLWTDLKNGWSNQLDWWLADWPGIKEKWPNILQSREDCLGALDAVAAYIFADGRYEVFDWETEESIVSLERFRQVCQNYQENNQADNIRMLMSISPKALQLRP